MRNTCGNTEARTCNMVSQTEKQNLRSTSERHQLDNLGQSHPLSKHTVCLFIWWNVLDDILFNIIFLSKILLKNYVL